MSTSDLAAERHIRDFDFCVISDEPAMDLKHLDMTDIIEICIWSMETPFSV